MNLDLFTRSRNVRGLACGVVLAAGLFTVSARADGWDKKTLLTVNQPVQITDTYLEPGQYVLKLLNSQADRHVVQIFNRDETHIINTVLAVPAYRGQPTSRSQFTFWETPPGTARAIRDWYYPGDNAGNEFPYPKQPRQLALLTPPAAVANFSSEETTTATTTTMPAAPPTTVDTSETQQQMDQTEEEPAPPAPAPEAAPPAPPQDTPAPPTELPKTGSPYPLIGFCGVGLAGLAGLLLIKRSA
jgi:LPXTG-motif cell wall-anchored protein